MSTDLIPLDQLNLPAKTDVSNEDFEKLTKSSSFLKRVQLFGSGTAVKRKLIGPGEFGIPKSKDDISSLGESIDVVVFARRPKAMDFTDQEAIIANYDPNSDTFKDIAARSAEKKSKCMYGVSFLIFERSTSEFLEYFAGTKSARQEAGNLYPYLPLTQEQIDERAKAGEDVSSLQPHGPRAATVTARLKERGDFSWYIPAVTPCSTPIKLPSVADIQEQIDRFLNPPTSTVEKVDEEEVKGRRAR